MKMLGFILPVLSLLNATLVSASTFTTSRDEALQSYACTFTADTKIVGHGQLFNSREKSHGSNAYEVKIIFFEDTAAFIKANYGPANYANSQSGVIHDYNYELMGPDSVDLQPIEGSHHGLRALRFAGDINNRQDIVTDNTLDIRIQTNGSVDLDFKIQDRVFEGVPRTSIPALDLIPRHAHLSGHCD